MTHVPSSASVLLAGKRVNRTVVEFENVLMAELREISELAWETINTSGEVDKPLAIHVKIDGVNLEIVRQSITHRAATCKIWEEGASLKVSPVLTLRNDAELWHALHSWFSER